MIAAVDDAARAARLHVGMPLAQAQAMIPDLTVLPATPDDDAVALVELAAWCLRWSPQTCADGSDGLWVDSTGCDHLFGGEAALLKAMLGHFKDHGHTARIAVADTAGAAHALARHGQGQTIIVPSGGHSAAIADLPVAALRLPPETVIALRRLGFDTIRQLAATPRAPLARRFGQNALCRLDQAVGRVSDPIAFVLPPDIHHKRMTFLEPLVTADAFAHVIDEMMPLLCGRLEAEGLGARQLDLHFERIDNAVQVIRVGTAKAVRSIPHLVRLFREKLDTVEPGFGVEAMQLVASLVEPLAYTQACTSLDTSQDNQADLSGLIDRLINRFGASKVYRIEFTEHDVPERSVRRISAMSKPSSLAVALAPIQRPRPIRLLKRPQSIKVLAELPDHPPVAFMWRQKRHRVCFADGPERIAGEWWRRNDERSGVRDYWRVEDENGQRFWLYRRGDGDDPATGDLSWFLHGFF